MEIYGFLQSSLYTNIVHRYSYINMHVCRHIAGKYHFLENFLTPLALYSNLGKLPPELGELRTPIFPYLAKSV